MDNLTEPQEHHSVPRTSFNAAQGDRTSLSASTRRSSVTVRERVTTQISTTVYPILIVFFYAIFAITSWVVLCVASKRPVRKADTYYQVSEFPADELAPLLKSNESTVKAMEVLLSIATLLTIPVTSAICGFACLAYMQSGKRSKGLTLMKTMALADQGWLSPRLWWSGNKIGSVPLFIAFALCLIGSASQIIQHAFINHEDIRVAPYYYTESYSMVDIPDMFEEDEYQPIEDDGQIIYQLRSALDAMQGSQQEHNLWSREFYDQLNLQASQSLETMATAPNVDYFYSPLPSNFSTGAFPGRQYAPRISSTVKYANISEEEFRSSCTNETENGGFYADYFQNYPESDSYYISLRACMPADLRTSPWRATRDQQEIEEVLYLNASARYVSIADALIKITATSELGYFELPSQKNGGNAGALLEKSPFGSDDDDDAVGQIRGRSKSRKTKRTDTPDSTDAGNLTLPMTTNKGPLTTLALALFGENSFVHTRVSNPEAYTVYRPNTTGTYRSWPQNTGSCIGLAPMGLLFSFSYLRCIDDYSGQDVTDVYNSVREWLSVWGAPSDYSRRQMASSLRMALFLANKLWLGKQSVDYPWPSLDVYSTPGVPTSKPDISDVGITVGSVFVGVHLLGLVALAVYATAKGAWVKGGLGAEAMLKLGMVHGPLLVGVVDGGSEKSRRQWEQTTEHLAGWVGDERPAESVGKMAVGGEGGLRKGRRFEVVQ